MSNSYRIAFVTSQAFSINNFRGSLIREMVHRGFVVYALAPDYDEATRTAVVKLGAIPVDCPMSRTGMNPGSDFINLLKLSSQLRHLKVDVVFSYFIKPVIYGTLAARIAGVPKRLAMIEGAGYVYTDGDETSISRRVLRVFVTKLYQISLRYASLVYLLNKDDRALFVNKRMVIDRKIELLNGIGIDLTHYEPTHLTTKPVTFILIARLLREKGIYDYVEAARLVKSKHPKVRFLLLGDTDLNPGSVKQAEVYSWVSEGLIEWPGHVTDVRVWIAQASVFVLPSYYREGLPRSTQEAMAMGLPIITTDSPGCRETVIEGVNGFLVPPRNPQALAQAMSQFVEQSEMIIQMGIASRQLAEENFDVLKINAQILQSMEAIS
ncbi:glycosyltransferase family 4 protein [Geomonas agri]|uniref:glycosyltransferase family 4 protein n=1 Tax=Geomonas agri TaxID=2873702 RepID=UPI001CD476EF|nr:glycosyltransferase family 4 protein [Geomonas agri]